MTTTISTDLASVCSLKLTWSLRGKIDFMFGFMDTVTPYTGKFQHW